MTSHWSLDDNVVRCCVVMMMFDVFRALSVVSGAPGGCEPCQECQDGVKTKDIVTIPGWSQSGGWLHQAGQDRPLPGRHLVQSGETLQGQSWGYLMSVTFNCFCLQDHVEEILRKWESIDDEIWAKVIVLERNRRVAKVSEGEEMPDWQWQLVIIFRLTRGPLSSRLMAETGALMDTGYNRFKIAN